MEDVVFGGVGEGDVGDDRVDRLGDRMFWGRGWGDEEVDEGRVVVEIVDVGEGEVGEVGGEGGKEGMGEGGRVDLGGGG